MARPVTNPDRIKRTLFLDKHLYRQAGIYAAQVGKSKSDVAEEALTMYLQSKQTPTPQAEAK